MHLTLILFSLSFLIHLSCAFGMFEPPQDSAIGAAIAKDDTASLQPLLEEEVLKGLKVSESIYLHWAAQANALKIADMLITQGFDVNLQISEPNRQPNEPEKMTPLMVAAAKNRPEIIKLLIGKGALLEKQNPAGYTALLLAITKNSNDAARVLIENNANVQTWTYEKTTVDNKTQTQKFEPLRSAASRNNIEILNLLIDKGALLEERTPQDATALHMALLRGASSSARVLIERGANIEAVTLTFMEVGTHAFPAGSTPLMLAAVTNNVEIRSLLLEKNAKLEAQTSAGETALHLAIRNKAIDATRILIEKGANVNAQTSQLIIFDNTPWTAKKTPLMLASRFNDIQTLNLLIKAGANPNAQDSDGITALHLAADYNASEAARILLDNAATIEALSSATKETPLMLAAKRNHIETLSLLLDKGAQLEAKDSTGNTPLILSLHYGAYNAAKTLIEREANLEIIMHENFETEMQPFLLGARPLMWAARFNNIEILNSLIEKGAQLDAQTCFGETALHIAIRFNADDTAKRLIEKGANIEAVTVKYFKFGNRGDCGPQITPLMMLAATNKSKILLFLVEKGAQLGPKNSNGWTALDVAFWNKANEAARILIDKTPSFPTMIAQNQAPLLAALRGNNPDGVFLLIEKGCDINSGPPGNSVWSVIIRENRDIALAVLEKFPEKIKPYTITNLLDITTIQNIAAEIPYSKFRNLCRLILNRFQEVSSTAERLKKDQLDKCKLEYDRNCALIHEAHGEMLKAKNSLVLSYCTKALAQENQKKRRLQDDFNTDFDSQIKAFEPQPEEELSESSAKKAHLEKLSKLTLEQIKEVVKIVRGSSLAEKNCTFLATEILRFFKTLEMPKGPALERPATIDDFCVQFNWCPLIQSDSAIKQEATSATKKQFIASLQKPTLVQYTGIKHLEELLPPQCIPHETTNSNGKLVLDLANPAISFTSLRPYEVHYINLEESLLKQASKNTAGVSYGFITLAYLEKLPIKKPVAGHMIAYFVQNKRVFFIDAQQLRRGVGEPITSVITNLGEFIKPESVQNFDALKGMAQLPVYCPCVWYLPMEVDILQD